ncbi:MAG: anthranilate synthase component I [Rhodocyclaceae bacterium]|jgi:anthranilate synthase component 1|nr:anthranilate synthase component I [Rhodocyclaceae bacterium]MCE2722410.1 anthranilate synthase component I [Betaproteobacteria bacterium]MCA3027592.1 anthranilate synthase component I [Rhodocyclaceae bacterium]MCA3031223.1 anthranilate synthase component I [Rhodocyclaceae bacterium]MCA3038744.1 anthranilate synthase component I [Rhodocyclaceae bacterium]
MIEAQFQRLAAEGYNRIPVTLETFADLDTPLSIYLKLANKPHSYLLESVIGGERFGRYSIIGLPAREWLEVRGREVVVFRAKTGGTPEKVEHKFVEDPLAFIEKYQARFRAAPIEGALRFAGGLAGYFGYDTVRYIEPKLAKHLDDKFVAKPDALGTPDIVLMVSDELAVVDNLSGRLTMIVYADPAVENAFENTQRRLTELRMQLRSQAPLPVYVPSGRKHEPKSEIGKERFLRAVERSKQYIVDGDIMQVQISQRISQPFDAPPINLYRALRSINPSPYMFYFDMGEFHIVGASPEILVRQEGEKVTVRPIAGTRKRGATPELDAALEAELRADPKELAEHLMLIDLGRNDLGRIAKIGSVEVTEHYVVERYSHVMHLVSNVDGKIRQDVCPIDLLRATFPAGTVTGTTKVRAMEIIDELEPSKRGIYAGAAGYLGFNGNLDLAIAIRTGVVKDGVLYAQAAAGIVADSVPELEWQETENKARALLRAAEMVATGLDMTS